MISNIARLQTLNRLGKESEVTGYLGTSLSGVFRAAWGGLTHMGPHHSTPAGSKPLHRLLNPKPIP